MSSLVAKVLSPIWKVIGPKLDAYTGGEFKGFDPHLMLKKNMTTVGVQPPKKELPSFVYFLYIML